MLVLLERRLVLLLLLLLLFLPTHLYVLPHFCFSLLFFSLSLSPFLVVCVCVGCFFLFLFPLCKLCGILVDSFNNLSVPLPPSPPFPHATDSLACTLFFVCFCFFFFLCPAVSFLSRRVFPHHCPQQQFLSCSSCVCSCWLSLLSVSAAMVPKMLLATAVLAVLAGVVVSQNGYCLPPCNPCTPQIGQSFFPNRAGEMGEERLRDYVLVLLFGLSVCGCLYILLVPFSMPFAMHFGFPLPSLPPFPSVGCSRACALLL